MLFQRLLSVNAADFTAKASWTTEAQLAPSNLVQPRIQASDMTAHAGRSKAWRYRASGIVGCTGTPTFTWVVRLNTATASIAGAVLAQSAAITCQSGISNQSWWLDVAFTIYTIGGSGTASLLWAKVESPGGFAAPYSYGMWPGGAASATWTQTYSTIVDQYVSLSAACSASDASNTITVKGETLEELN